jgi:outer membrane protein OmpA-like peptidoglycan-associated protein
MTLYMRVAAGLLGGFLLVPDFVALAQTTELAVAAQPRPGYVVFFGNDRHELSPAAAETIRAAASEAQSSNAKTIRLIGRADHIEAVKNEMVRDGVPAGSIVLIGPDESRPLVKGPDSLAELLNRRVQIAF